MLSRVGLTRPEIDLTDDSTWPPGVNDDDRLLRPARTTRRTRGCPRLRLTPAPRVAYALGLAPLAEVPGGDRRAGRDRARRDRRRGRDRTGREIDDADREWSTWTPRTTASPVNATSPTRSRPCTGPLRRPARRGDGQNYLRQRAPSTQVALRNPTTGRCRRCGRARPRSTTSVAWARTARSGARLDSSGYCCSPRGARAVAVHVQVRPQRAERGVDPPTGARATVTTAKLTPKPPGIVEPSPQGPALYMAVAFQRRSLQPFLDRPLTETLPEQIPPTADDDRQGARGGAGERVTAQALFSSRRSGPRTGATSCAGSASASVGS